MENNRLDFLPNEIIDKILLFRDPHPMADILKHLINNYNDYNDFNAYNIHNVYNNYNFFVDEDDNTPFYYYVLELSDKCYMETLWLKGYRIRIKNNLNRLKCCQCSKLFELYDKYLMNTKRNTIHCRNCVEAINY